MGFADTNRTADILLSRSKKRQEYKLNGNTSNFEDCRNHKEIYQIFMKLDHPPSHVRAHRHSCTFSAYLKRISLEIWAFYFPSPHNNLSDNCRKLKHASITNGVLRAHCCFIEFEPGVRFDVIKAKVASAVTVVSPEAVQAPGKGTSRKVSIKQKQIRRYELAIEAKPSL